MLTGSNSVFVGDAVSDQYRFTAFANGRGILLGCFRNRGCRRGTRCRGRSRSRPAAAHVEGDQRLVHFHYVAHVAVERNDGTGVRTRKFDGGLRGLDVHQGLVQRDDVADVDLPGDNLGFDETFANVG